MMHQTFRPPRLAALICAGALALAAPAAQGQGALNLNDLTGSGTPAPASGASAAPTTAELVRVPSPASAFESGGVTWYRLNNVGVNRVNRIRLPASLIGAKGHIIVAVDDIGWSNGSRDLTGPVDAGAPAAGRGYYFETLPADALVLWLREAGVAYELRALDRARPALIDLRGSDSFVLLVNDAPAKEGEDPLLDNSGAFDLYFAPYAPK